MWNKTTHDFGTVKPKKELTASFEYLGDKKITEVKASCGCTTFKNEGNIITLTYESTSIPNHLKKNGVTTLDFNKTATVTFDDDSKTTLTIKGLISK
jgi:hypothetical protein